MTDQFDGAIEARFNDHAYGRVETSTSTPSVHYVNEAGLSETEMDQIRNNRDVANLVEKWTQELNASLAPMPSVDMFNRGNWSGAKHPFAIMSQCAWSVENDDILSTLADVTEGLAFGKCRFELMDEDQQDVWNQWAAEIDLDSRLRECFRELFKVSQVYVGLWWENRTFTVRDRPISQVLDTLQQSEGEGDPAPRRGNRRRRKKYSVDVPTAMTIFDPTKVIPVGSLMFGRERFAYVADGGESAAFSEVMQGNRPDATVLQLIERRYTPTPRDRELCSELGVDPDRLWLLRADSVFRHTLTRAQYEPFAPVRLKSVLPILEMKRHLRNSDRAMLVGNTNFIVVITKGSDKIPAKPAEIENLKEQSRIIARLPVLVGDHRLKVEIISPAMDNTLIESRWQVLDSRLVFKALQSFQPIVQGGNASSGVSEMSRVVSQGLQNRRHMLVRAFESKIFAKILERNADRELTERPSLEFSPKRITLDFKLDVMNAILKVRDRGDISRETMLEELDFDQETEALRRARERGQYDDVFASSVPHGSPQANPFGAPGQGAGVPSGQPPEGGRPPGVTEDEPRRRAGDKARADKTRAKSDKAAAVEQESQNAEE